MKDVHTHHARLTGEGVQQHLTDRSAIGKVVEGTARHAVAVPVQARRGVEAIAPQLHARHIGAGHGLFKRHALGPHHQRVIGQSNLGRVHAFLLGPMGDQPLGHGSGRILGGFSIEVAAGGGGRGGGVGNLVRVGCGDAHPAKRHAQLLRHHLGHLRVQALAHLGAPVVHQDGSVGVHVHQRSGLVEVCQVEGDAELHRCQRQAPLEHGTAGVIGGDVGPPLLVVAGPCQIVNQLVQDVVFHLLSVGGCAPQSPRQTVIEVHTANLQRVQAQHTGHSIEDGFDHQGPLRTTEPPEGRVALGIGARAEPLQVYGGQEVGVVKVAQGPRHHRCGKVGRVARVGNEQRPSAADAALMVKPHLPIDFEGMAAPGDHEVVVTVNAQLHGFAQGLRRDGRHAGKQGRLGFLATKAAAHAPALHLHVVGPQTQGMGHQVLHFAGVLGRTVQLEALVL